MKKLCLILAIAAALPNAYAVTATKEYVDRRDGEVAASMVPATNAAVTASKAYTDSRLVPATNAAVTASKAYTDSRLVPATNAAVTASKAYTDAAMNAINVGVTSVNGATGAVTLAASDVAAIPSTAGKHQTAPGCTTDYLASGAIGGARVIASSASPEYDYTAYARMGIAVRRLGGATKNYLYDDSTNGIVRRGEVAALVPPMDPTSVKSVYSDNATYRLRQNGATEAYGYDISTPIVNFTNSVGEIMLVGDGAGKWYHRDEHLGLLHFSRTDGWIVCDEYSFIRAVEYYPGYPILSMAILDGAVYAAPEGLSLGWHEISWLADESEVPSMVSNTVTKAYVESLGISSEETDPNIGLTNGTIYVKGQTITPITSHQSLAGYVPTSRTVNSKPLSSNVNLEASDVGAYSAANGAALAGQVATIGAHLNAEDARFVVTNYNSATHTPEAYVEIQLPDQSWSRIWSEMTRWNWLFDYFLPTNYYDKADVNAALAQKADRAWGFYDSTTGEYAPDGYTWISSERIAIAANLAYQRTITSEGSIWVLESNGTVTETGGLTNGFFRISDDEGNSLFEIVKGSKRTIGADASSCQVVGGFTPTKLQIGYSVVSDVHPTLYVCQSLSTQSWKAETDSDCIANVSWSGTSGAYVAQVQGKSAYPSMFVKATYEVGGETYISNAAPVAMQYLILNGVKYSVGTATISGNTVLTLTVAP